jgi:hypothetical protein
MLVTPPITLTLLYPPFYVSHTSFLYLYFYILNTRHADPPPFSTSLDSPHMSGLSEIVAFFITTLPPFPTSPDHLSNLSTDYKGCGLFFLALFLIAVA